MSYTERRERFVETKQSEAESALVARAVLSGDGGGPSFEDYLEPHGEFGLPVYTGLPDDRDICERIVSRRAEYIESAHRVNEREAYALAAAQAGMSARWTAEQVGVTPSTVSKYHERVEEKLGVGVFMEPPFTDLRQELNVGVKSYSECPNCESETVESVEEIMEVYNSTGELLDSADEDDTHVCTSCGLSLQRETGGDGDED